MSRSWKGFLACFRSLINRSRSPLMMKKGGRKKEGGEDEGMERKETG
jgi:hypothetical protein